MPEQVAGRTFHRSGFDRFGEAASGFAGNGAFFAGCVFILVLWLASYLVISDKNTWQLIINTIITIITFLLVALLANRRRPGRARLMPRRRAGIGPRFPPSAARA